MPAQEPAPSVWARPARKPRSSLTRDQIVAEAIRLLDAEGIEALSMRKLAARLGAGATSIYWHVANRDELIELVINEVNGELEVPGPDDAREWQSATRRFAHSMRSATHRHPWVVSVLDRLVAGYPGPNLARASEQMIAVFEAAGFELREADQVLNTVAGYASGIAIGEAALSSWLARHNQTPEDWINGTMQVAEQATQDHPRLRELVAGIESTDLKQASDADFDYGLDRVIDGLQARLDHLNQRS